MADIDLFRDAYRTHLGRDASDEEANNWVTGVYGGGSVQDRLNQIANSGEAQARKQQQPPVLGQNPNVSQPQDNTLGFGSADSGYGVGGVGNPAYQNPRGDFDRQIGEAYTQSLGRSASPDEINNWWSGGYGYGQGMSGLQSMLGAIRNSGEARARGPQPTTTGATTTPPPSSPGPQGGNFQQWFQSLIGGRAPSPQSLKELEPLLNQHGIRLGPSNARGFTDGIILPDGTFIDVIMGATTNGGSGWGWIQPTGAVGGGNLPGNQYSDPYTQMLEQLIKSRIGSLQGGYDDMLRRQYQDALQQRAGALATGNKQLDQLLGYLQERFTDLKGPGYTGAENEVLRTQALDPIERDRTAAKQQLTNRLAAMGHGPESGVFQQAMQQLDNEFMGMRAVTQTQLSTNELARRENRSQRAEAIGAQLADIPELRAREQLDVFRTLEQLGLTARNEDEARSREAISYGGVLSDLGPQRMQLAMQAAGMGGNPGSLGSVLTNLAGLNQRSSELDQRNNDSMMEGLGELWAIIERSRRSGASGFGG